LFTSVKKIGMWQIRSHISGITHTCPYFIPCDSIYVLTKPYQNVT
jgi:hypothetical protein